MTTWHAETREALQQIRGLVHDAWFDIDHVHHDDRGQTLTIPFAQEWEWGPMLDDSAWRNAPKAELVGKTWRYREERVPFMRGTLRIGAVESVTLDQGAGDAGMISDLRYDPVERTVTVDGIAGDLVANVRKLDVTAELVNQVALYVHRRRGFLSVTDQPLWDSR